jgi:hypothetical protein
MRYREWYVWMLVHHWKRFTRPSEPETPTPAVSLPVREKKGAPGPDPDQTQLFN